MKSLRKITTGAAALALPAFALCLWAQAATAPSPEQGSEPKSGATQTNSSSQRDAQGDAQTRIRVNTSLVVLPVTVKDRSGNLVPDLQRNEFRVFEDNIEQKI